MKKYLVFVFACFLVVSVALAAEGDYDPEAGRVLWDSGFKAFKDGNYIHAISLYKQAEEKGFKDMGVYWDMGLAYFFLAEQQFFKLNEKEKSVESYKLAFENYQKAAQLRPDFAPLFEELGQLYYSQGNLEEGKKNFQKAADLFEKAGDNSAAQEAKMHIDNPPDLSNPPVKIMFK